MRIFLTGATGYVGRAIAGALADHEVVALVRSPDKARGFTHAVVGDLGRPEGYVAEAADCDAIIHAGFEYLPDGSESEGTDERATAALLEVARGRFVYTSNAYLLRTRGGDPVDETVDPAALGVTGWRTALERRVVERGAAVVRLGFVYGGEAGGGTLPDLFAAAHRNGRLGIPGTGQARASFIHHHDAAALFRTVVDQRATGVYHATDGRPTTAADVVRTICRVTGVSAEAAPAETLGLDAHTLDILDRDVAVISPRSHALGWRPRFSDFAAGAETAYVEWARNGLSRSFSSR